jgi:hydrogenase maturation protein HypF
VSAGVAPGLDELGVMLPYAPVHQLLFSAGPGAPPTVPQVLVMTSGNLSDEPLAFDNDDALARLGAIADLFLLHDRGIAVPCEDSVVTVRDGFEVPVRRSRGFAPLPLWLEGAEDAPAVLAVGGEIKNAFSVTRGGFAFMSAHLGEMGSLESMAAFDRSVEQLLALHGVEPQVIAADDHPGYNTRAWADRRGERDGLPVVTVQHHHAHFASLLAEHGRQNLTDGPAVGIVLDGTGYGCDKTVWGGEILLVEDDIATAERVGHIEPFLLPGGDAAVRNPFRVALSLLHLAGLDDAGLDLAEAIGPDERQLVNTMLATRTGCVTTSSAGRLFDGVASLIGVRHRIGYEAQAAIELEALAHTATAAVPLAAALDGGVLRLGGLVGGIVAAVLAEEDGAAIALGFHEALAQALADAAIGACSTSGARTVGLSGGVFANRLLTAALTRRLARGGVEVLTHRVVPCNDGGLALGQAVVAHARTRRGGD